MSALLTASVVSLIAAITVARAESTTPQSLPQERATILGPQSEWDIQFRPYIWAASLDGTIMVQGQPANVDVSFSDYVSDVDVTWASTLDISRRGSSWTFFLDTLYMKLGPDPQPTAPGTLPRVTDITIEQALIDGWIGYRIAEWDEGWLDILGGLRWQYLKNEIEFAAPAGFGTRSASQDWIDPHFGLRFKHYFTHKLYTGGIIDVGGFGVGSDLSIEAGLGLGYHLSDCIALELSYRLLDVDFSDGAFAYDVTSHGIFTGLAFYF